MFADHCRQAQERQFSAMGLGVALRAPIRASATFLTAGATFFVDAQARAGFLQAEGTTQVITSGSASRFSRQFDAGGRLKRAATFSKAHLETWAQHGLNERMMLIARFGQESLWPGVTDETSVLSRQSFAEAGARVEAGRIGELRLSAQLLGGWRVCGCGPNGATVDARAIAALPFKAVDRDAFAEVQIGYRHGARIERSEWRAEATLGVRAMPEVLLLAQAQWASAQREGTAPHAWRIKAELGVVWDFSERWSVQLGGFTTLAGRNAAQENGVRLAIWRRLGPLPQRSFAAY